MVIVSDTSSISNLYQIGLIDILKGLYGEIWITPAVQRELYVISKQQDAIDKLKWIKVKVPVNQKLVLKLLEDLDLGEAEAIALAIEQKANYLIIDEYMGRLVADKYGVKIVGVLGILILAKKKGLISSVKVEIGKLQAIGFRLNKKLIAKVLNKLGE